jgi:AcrR family transcriptional regulator
MKRSSMARKVARSAGDRTRQAILESAYRLMIRRGFAATSMREIASHAHLALGGIYNHFSSKEDIFRTIMQERHPFLQIVPMLSAVPGETPEEFVHNAAHVFVQQLGRHPDFLNLMLTEIVEFKARHVPALFGKFYPMLPPLAKRMIDSDGRTRQIPEFVVARAFIGMFFSYYFTEILLGRAMPTGTNGNAIEHFVDIFLHGILEEQHL